MMMFKDIYPKLKELGYPIAYHHFNKTPKTPYIVYFVNGSDNFSAEGMAYLKVKQLDIELYTEKKDLDAEKKLEKFFDDNQMYFKSDEDYIESEKYYQIKYETEVF